MKRALILLAAALGCIGCGALRPNYVPVRTYAIETQIELEPLGKTLAPALGVRRFTAAGGYRYPMVFRAGDVAVRAYEYDRWLELPDEMATRAFTTALRSAGLFGEVEPLGALRHPRYVLDGEVTRFEEWESEAHCDVYLRLIDTEQDRVVWSERVVGRAPLDAPTPEALARGMRHALASAAAQAVASLAELDPLPGDAPAVNTSLQTGAPASPQR